MTKQTVYLAGPIAGSKDPETWRQSAITGLWSRYRITGIDPYSFDIHNNPDHWANTDRSIVDRAHHHATRCGMVIAYLLGVTSRSIGTIAEIAWAYGAQVPVVVVMESGNPHHHPMVNGCASFVVDTLDDAIDAAGLVLGQYAAGPQFSAVQSIGGK